MTLFPYEQRFLEVVDVRQTYSPTEVAELCARLSLKSRAGFRSIRSGIRRKMGVDPHSIPPSQALLDKWERDPLDDETPREARARVARELAEGRRCQARMFSGRPCSLLLPCASHGR